eukprot:TRINITY_DN7626_c0_g2_i6.p1 TRINITY_DN7626_c0_g2~~TRINITY_DN7626_c0_g2_i6.p1  ORF type:complete len:197 (-),score=-19.24 TRINITY_DN7626_c0_g2_i6:122-712(-)
MHNLCILNNRNTVVKSKQRLFQSSVFQNSVSQKTYQMQNAQQCYCRYWEVSLNQRSLNREATLYLQNQYKFADLFNQKVCDCMILVSLYDILVFCIKLIFEGLEIMMTAVLTAVRMLNCRQKIIMKLQGVIFAKLQLVYLLANIQPDLGQLLGLSYKYLNSKFNLLLSITTTLYTYIQEYNRLVNILCLIYRDCKW